MVLGRNWSAAGHLHIQHLFSVIHVAAKVHGLGLEMEIWEVDFSLNSVMRMLHEAHPQNPLCHPAIQIVLISWVLISCRDEVPLLH